MAMLLTTTLTAGHGLSTVANLFFDFPWTTVELSPFVVVMWSAVVCILFSTFAMVHFWQRSDEAAADLVCTRADITQGQLPVAVTAAPPAASPHLVEEQEAVLDERPGPAAPTPEPRRSPLPARPAEARPQTASGAAALSRMLPDIELALQGIIDDLTAVETTANGETGNRLQRARNSAASLQRILTDLFRAPESPAAPARQDFRLRDLLGKICADQLPAAKAAGIRLRSAVAPEVPEYLSGQAAVLHQALEEIISLALQQPVTGSDVTVAIESRGFSHDDVLLLVSVGETQLLHSVKQRAVEEDLATDTELCLGDMLPQATQLAPLLGGSAWSESPAPGRSTFHLTCMFKRQHDEDDAIPFGLLPTVFSPSTINPDGDLATDGLTVLVADSDTDRCERTLAALAGHRHAITTVATGPQALAAVEQQDFDLLLIGAALAGEDAFEVTRAIRRREAQSERRTTVVMLANNPHPRDRQRCLKVGIDALLGEPLRYRHLTTMLASFFGRGH